MDHHCPWVSNCIGFHNYKYFLLMLFYTSVCTFMIVATSWKPVELVLYEIEKPNREQLLITYCVLTSYILAFTLWLVITSFFIFHLYLIKSGFTTIEFCEKKTKESQQVDESPFNLGFKKNFQAALGKNCWLWFIPTGIELYE